ncbi:uncharacterized protein BO80DRAFT_264546 [Aspergillus ibericus CBS 121593]|uniref:Glutamic acid-rich protein n=1 Tax=Aspergillus ibericus CBS 121593 TaxID=1448316 RepID=A0A395GIU6_9EURO|nr:hypothetical protein BO80DRAFT_264546 [Aspergillus ibericus CBS 121593]RAK95390.1 hypothetical protein BO80DRAFT_264546 [Aspergillus ibericus CBS 121593]
MTTASSLAFTTMEISVADDQMEMASPYQGHADDFDIDIDIMEDQASTTDKDMIGADEYLDYDHDGTHDADMIDDVAEPTMQDADDAYAEADYTVEMQDGNERIYEAEMLEDEYDEDIDAPVAEAQEVAPASEEVQNPEAEGTRPSEEITITAEDKDEPDRELHPDQEAEPLAHDDRPFSHDTEQHVDLSEKNVPQEYEVDTAGSPENGKPFGDSNKAKREVPHTTETDVKNDNNESSKQAQSQASSFGDAQPLADERNDSAAQTQDKLEEEDEGEYHVGDVGDAEDGGVREDEQEEGEGQVVTGVSENQVSSSEEQAVEHQHEQQELPATERTPLHPVKVYYQDNEISLFPPREGDSSETFFLEDESLAFGSFGRLFESCREVLRDHISDSDVLIVDVEALNVQLTEDSLHTDKVTLHQIVDLYLRLSHNDGIEEPEALYLTLSTRPTIFAEISNLLVDAKEGKGLSEIYWDGYAEAEATSADIPGESHEEFNPDYLQQDSSEPEDDYSDSEKDHEPEAESQLHDGVTGEQQDEQDHEGHGHLASGNDEVVVPSSGNVPEGTNAEDGHLHESNSAETEAIKVGDHQLPTEELYDSEEQSESTATVTQLPQPDLLDEQQLANETAAVLDDPDYHEYHGTEGAGDETYPEETNVDATEHFGPHEDAEAVETGENTGETVGEFYGDVTESNAEESREDALEDINNTTHFKDDAGDADFHDHEDVDGEVPPSGRGEEAPYDNTEPVPDSVSEDVPDITESTQNLEDDSLGIVEDLLKSPSKDIKHIGDETNADELEPGELHDEPEHVPATHDEVEELAFDDEEYLDLGVQEGLAADDEANLAKSPSRAPTKRYREPEDDFELTEIPTPDAKRSRSS